MPTPFEHLASFNRLIHEPARLAIVTALAACEKADFVFLRTLTGLTKGNLSSHLAKLEAAGLVDVVKSFRGKRPLTTLSLTSRGRDALADYRKRLASVVAGIPELSPKDS